MKRLVGIVIGLNYLLGIVNLILYYYTKNGDCGLIGGLNIAMAAILELSQEKSLNDSEN